MPDKTEPAELWYYCISKTRASLKTNKAEMNYNRYIKEMTCFETSPWDEFGKSGWKTAKKKYNVCVIFDIINVSFESAGEDRNCTTKTKSTQGLKETPTQNTNTHPYAYQDWNNRFSHHNLYCLITLQLSSVIIETETSHDTNSTQN